MDEPFNQPDTPLIRNPIAQRVIKLEGAWWQADCGVLIGFWGPEESPVALVPKRGGYTLWRDGVRVGLTPELAEYLHPYALMVYHAPRGIAIQAAKWAAGLGFAAGLLCVGLLMILAGYGQGLLALMASIGLLAWVQREFFHDERLTFTHWHAALWMHLLSLPLTFFYPIRQLERDTLGRALETIRAEVSGLMLGSGFALALMWVNLLAAFGMGLGGPLIVWMAIWGGLQAVLLVNLTRQQRALNIAKQRATHAAHQLISAIQTLPIQHSPTWAEYHAQTGPVRTDAILRRGAVLVGLALIGAQTRDILAWGMLIQVGWAALRLDAILQQATTWLPLAQDLYTAWRTPAQDDARGHESEDGQAVVVLEDVRFRHNPHIPPVLESLSLVVHRGESLAIVGAAGCGKSSLLNLILGFEQPESGSIRYQGIRRAEMGYVMQESRLQAGSLKSNLLGNHNLPLEEAWHAARIACIDDLIHDLRMGMMTLLDEGGAAFSRGQQQRLLLARALVHRPKLLLLDEALGAIDGATRQKIHDNLKTEGITRVMVVYNSSEMRHADRVAFMQRGRIVGSGPYEELYQAHEGFRDWVAGQATEHSAVESQ